MGDVNISELLGDQPLIDETDLPDAGDDGYEDDGSSGGAPASAEPPAGNEPPADPYAGKKNVPLKALQEERQRRQELQDRLASREQQTQAMEQRFQQMQQLWLQQQQVQIQQQQPQQPPAPVPTFVDDPEGYVNHLKAQFEAKIAELQGYQQQAVQHQQADYQGQQLARQVAVAEQEFIKTTPDYADAANYFAQRKQLEYAALGADPITIQQQLQRDYQGIAVAAAQTGRNPAELLYNLSKAVGYTKALAKPAGQGAKPAKPAAPTSLSDVAGAPRAPDEEGGVTLESISQMTDAEFDKFFNNMARGSRQRPTY